MLTPITMGPQWVSHMIGGGMISSPGREWTWDNVQLPVTMIIVAVVMAAVIVLGTGMVRL